MRRFACCAVGALVVGFLATPAASAQQSLNFYIGGFTPRSEDARTTGDVLVSDLSAGRDSLLFNIKDFNAVTFGGEWLVGVGNYLETGLGVGLYSRTVPSVYALQVNQTGSEIEQDLKLRMVPFTATVRFLPLGNHDAVTPYIGAGVAIINWRYSETGDFVDFRDNSIFRASYVGKGTETGPVILGGIRVPVGSWGVGGEVRYQSAEGTLPSDVNFLGSKIDLGGFTYSFTVNVRF